MSGALLASIDAESAVALVLAVALVIYLVVALVHPERF